MLLEIYNMSITFSSQAGAGNQPAKSAHAFTQTFVFFSKNSRMSSETEAEENPDEGGFEVKLEQFASGVQQQG